MDERKDIEVGQVGDKAVTLTTETESMKNSNQDAGNAEVASLREKTSVFAKMRAWELWLDRKLKFEPMGIERLHEDARRPPRSMNMMLIWFSLLTAPGMVTIGALGPIFGLSVADSILITVIGTLVGSVFPAWTATLVPLTGLRQVAFSRYAFGIQGSKLCGALTVFVNIGYAVIGAILAGQFLRAVSGGSLDISLGIVLVVLLALVVSFLGYHVLHMYESVAWILIFILLMVQFGQSAPRFPSDITSHELQGIDYVGSGLTFFSIMFGQCVAWCACAGDYYVHFPADVNKWKVAGLTWLGMALPTIFGAVLGCYIGGAVISDQDLAAIYATDGIGQVILDLLHPSGFSKFVGVFYAFASLANLAATFYSSALAIQVLHARFIAVPRFIWVLIIGAVTLALALGGRNVFENILANLLPILGYWTICFAAVLFIEHYLFRPRLGGYDLDGWRDSKRTPVGIAATATLLTCIGISFLGMCQTWYIGPLAKLIGAYGGDVSDYLILVVAPVMYTLGRMWEIKVFGR